MKYGSTKTLFSRKIGKNGILRVLWRVVPAVALIVAGIAMWPQNTLAGQATLDWVASSNPGVAGYKLYFSTESGNYVQSVDVGNTTNCTISDLVDGQTYYFAARTYDIAGNYSGYSNEVSKTISASIPPTSQYTINTSAGAGGTISPQGSLAVNEGESATFSMTPNTGYYLKELKVDGVVVGRIPTYTFSNVSENHIITATFDVATYNVAAFMSNGGSISPVSATISYGGTKKFTIKPKNGFAIQNVVVDGVSVGAVSSYTFSNVTKDHTISALFFKKRI